MTLKLADLKLARLEASGCSPAFHSAGVRDAHLDSEDAAIPTQDIRYTTSAFPLLLDRNIDQVDRCATTPG